MQSSAPVYSTPNSITAAKIEPAVNGGGIPPAAAVYEDLVIKEMSTILNQILIDLNTPAAMTLDELRVENPPLYAQIRSQAESNAKAAWLQRLQLPVAPTGQRHFRGPNQQMQQQQQQQPQPQNRPAYPHHYQQQKHHVAGQHVPRPGQYQKRGIDEVYSNGQVPHQQQPSGYTQHPRATLGSTSPTGGSLDFVNGFVCETPVVIDVHRVQLLADSLSTMTQQSAVTALSTPALQSITSKIAQRLHHYLQNIMVPPDLPSILSSPAFVSSLPAMEAIPALQRLRSNGPDSSNGNGSKIPYVEFK